MRVFKFYDDTRDMNTGRFAEIFSDQTMKELFPAERADNFFEALFGDADEGSYDIHLNYNGFDNRSSTLRFQLDLVERPGHCLACNMTYGLPEVFSRHPVINIKGIVSDVQEKLGKELQCESWRLGHTSPRLQQNLRALWPDTAYHPLFPARSRCSFVCPILSGLY